MNKSRTPAIALGIILILLSAFMSWRASHPAQTDDQILLADLDNAASAINDRSAARVSSYLAHDFKWNDTSRDDFHTAMVGAFWQWRNVDLRLSNEQVQVSGDTATTTGHYSMSYQPSDGAPPENHSGNFNLQWQRKDGTWLVESASGGEKVE